MYLYWLDNYKAMRPFLICLCLLGLSSLVAQNIKESEVPNAVIQQVTAEFPDQKIRSWTTSAGNYIGQTRIEGATAFLVFNESGKYLRTTYPLSSKELPTRLLDYVDKSFKGARIGNSELVEDESGLDYYGIELRKEGVGQGKLAELKFDMNGNLMQRVDFETQEPLPPAIVIPDQDAIRKMKEGKTVTGAISKLTSSQVPPAVVANFNKKFPRSEAASWYLLGEDYGVDFMFKETRNEAHYSASGAWILTKEEMLPDYIYAPVQRYLETEYPRYDIKYAEKITRADRINTFYVEVFQRVKGVSEPPVTQLFFDNTGRIERANTPQVDDDSAGTDDAQVTTNPRFDRQFEKDIDGLKEGTKRGKKLKEQELPTGITSYIYGRYPSVKIKETVLDDDSQWGTVYRVLISKEGLMQTSYELYFDTFGKLLQDNAPEELVSKKVKQADTSDPIQEMDDEEEEVETKPSVRATDIPDVVVKNQARRYPRSEELEWDEGPNNRYVAHFYFRELKHSLTMDAAGVILETRTEMAQDRMYRPIMTYLDENYPEYKITYAEQIVRKDRINYYYLELTAKKRKTSPQSQYFFFDKMGKPMDEEPEL